MTRNRRRGGPTTRRKGVTPTRAVTTASRPWGLIAASVAVAAFAVATIGYAVVQVNRAEAGKVTALEQVPGVRTFEEPADAGHVPTKVEYPQNPPVSGQMDSDWADCTGTVYDVDIRNENAVHSLEHGAVWITYDPERVDEDGVAALRDLVDGTGGLMLSPRQGLDSPISVQAWRTQLTAESATDERIAQFADFMAFNPENAPEPGAMCQNPAFISAPRVADEV